ncbi:cytochrome c [Pigmentiphaga sp. H8]|uniref:c-type cytochrome n=1 Tax=Pigmentiphaga sp. H8 TaxID=2488560 RepID=UPI000F59DD64|nr:cytochrome c [Pigmentiphaga sp. H8]AZG06995.1 cytochrome c [Pigmentiphaga sp. H8]
MMFKPLIALFALAIPYAAQAQESGASLYQKNCLACHQAKGQGIPGAFPALAGSAFVAGDRTELLATILKGRGGMPAFAGSMNDEQIAAVATYLRDDWNGKAGPVQSAQVAAVRKGGNAVQYSQSQARPNN